MKPEIMEKAYAEFKGGAIELFTRLHELCVEVGNPELRRVAEGLVKNVHAPFLFVVVGEVKSGKSSLVNALLGDEICRVAPEPCTDIIQKIVYSSRPYRHSISEHLVEVGCPSEILKEIAIVDTPGVNTIMERHQEITERFIPESDLAIFVFPVLNPYSRTSWDFLNFVNEKWRKKVVFVLQQSDRASPEELAVNSAKAAELAKARGMNNPKVFCVSAKRAKTDPEMSGLPELWRLIRETVTGGQSYLLKMKSLTDTAGLIMDDAARALALQEKGLEEDRAEQARIKRGLERGRKASLRDVQGLKERLVQSYSKLAQSAVEEFEAGLSVASLFKNSFKGLFGRKNTLKQWVDGLNEDFNRDFSREVELISRGAASEISGPISELMQTLLTDLKSGVSADPKGLNLTTIAQDRLNVIDEVVEKVFTLLGDDSLNQKLRPPDLRKIGDRAVMGGFITALGAVIAASTHAIVFDVTGGVFTTIGALLAINTIAFKRRGVVSRFRQGFDAGKAKLEEDLGLELGRRIDSIYQQLGRAFEPFFENIVESEEKLNGLKEKHQKLADKLKAQNETIDGLSLDRAKSGEKDGE